MADKHAERLLENIELVRSRGDPGRNKLCIMALVARLAGEAHSDHPEAASPLIAAYARPVNDAMDRQTRQRLIPFAPHIIGTTERADAARRDILNTWLHDTLLPHLVRDLQVAALDDTSAARAAITARLAGELGAAHAEDRPGLVQDRAWDRAALIAPLRVAVTAYRDGASIQQAEAVARLLIAGASRVARPSRRAWYWDQAIGLLDTLCNATGTPAKTAALQGTISA